jgi:hypothetical protein
MIIAHDVLVDPRFGEYRTADSSTISANSWGRLQVNATARPVGFKRRVFFSAVGGPAPARLRRSGEIGKTGLDFRHPPDGFGVQTGNVALPDTRTIRCAGSVPTYHRRCGPLIGWSRLIAS